MTQPHKRFTDDQVKVLLNRYCQGLVGSGEVQDILGIGKTLSWPKTPIRQAGRSFDGLSCDCR
jgi:hypothetical protein